MSTPAKWCSVCRSRFRGSYSVHASTKRHQAHLRSSGGRPNRYDVDRALGVVHHHVRKAIAGDQGADEQRVRAYRRRRPLDGPRRSVSVRRYWRHRAAVWRRNVRDAIGGVDWRPRR